MMQLTIDEFFAMEGLTNAEGDFVMSVEFLEILCRWVSGKSTDKDVVWLAEMCRRKKEQ